MKKKISIFKWLLAVIPIGLFGYATQWIMFFPAYLTRNIPILKWVFWIWLDDSRIGASDYAVVLNGRKETLWIAYKWHNRNRVWNLVTLFMPKKGYRFIVENVIDELYMGGKKISQHNTWIPMARVKYWKNGVEGSQINKGDFVSGNHSILGTGFVWEEMNDKLIFRYSFCGKKKYFFFWERYRVIQLGMNDKRAIFNYKHHKVKPIKF